MSLKIGILTTETVHHTFFVRELIKNYTDVTVFCESREVKSKPFETNHPFEKSRDKYEIDKWFKEKRIELEDIVDVKKFLSLNSPEAVKALKIKKLDIVIVFGTGRLKPQVIGINPNRIFNLHGGDPEKYRGLDTHLWAIYHNDFSALMTTLHRLTDKLDTGDIINQTVLPVPKKLPLHALRSLNTEICLKLTINTIQMISQYGEVFSRPQNQIGRYYSAMPKDLKSECIKKFENFTRNKINES